MKITMKEARTIGTEMLREVVEICERENIVYYAYFGTLLGAVRHGGPIPWDADIDIYVPEPYMKKFFKCMKSQLPDKYWIDFREPNNSPRLFARVGLKGYQTDSLHIDVFRLIGFPEKKYMRKIFMTQGRILFVIWKAKIINLKYEYKRRVVTKNLVRILKLFVKGINLSKIVRRFDQLCREYDYDTAKYVGFPMGSYKYLYEKADFNDVTKIEYEGIKLAVPSNYDKHLKHMYGNYMEFPPLKEQEAGMNRIIEVREIL